MAETILGIDLTPRGVRMVQLTRQFVRLTVTGWARADLPAGADLPATAAAVRRLAETRGLLSDVYALGLPTSQAMFRRLDFPFTSAGKIRQVLELEMDAHMPLSVDVLALDMVKAGRGVGGEQQVLAAAMPRKALEGWLEAFAASGMPLQVVDVTADALLAAAASLTGLPGKVLFLDIGAEASAIFWRMDGKPAAMRGLRFGLLDLDKALAANQASNDAEREASASNLAATRATVPVKAGMELQAALAAGGEAARRVQAAVDDFARDIRLTLRAAADGESVQPELVVLSGRAAAVQGLGRLLETRLQAPVQRIAQCGGFGLRAMPDGSQLPGDELAVAYGLALRGAPMFLPSEAGMNFHAEGAAMRRNAFDPRRYLALVSALLAVLVLGYVLSNATDIVLKRQRLAALEARLDEAYKQALPDVQPGFTRSQRASILAERLAGLRQGSQNDGAGRATALHILTAISQAVPADLPMTISQLGLDEQAVRISARSDAFASVERIKDSLQKAGLGDVELKGATASPDGNSVQFQVDILLASGGKP
ncbi:MAG: pilus assembly protein PilM [Desulfocurvibacter africanus]